MGDDVGCTEGLCPQPVGACCSDEGTCSHKTQDVCILDGGTYEGNGFVCEPNPCAKYIGACCGALGVCYETGQSLCKSAGDTYQGTGTTCSPGLCPEPVEWVVYTVDNGTCFDSTIIIARERSKFNEDDLLCNYWYYGENTCTLKAEKIEIQGGFDTQGKAYEWIDGLKGEWMLNSWCPGNG